MENANFGPSTLGLTLTLLLLTSYVMSPLLPPTFVLTTSAPLSLSPMIMAKRRDSCPSIQPTIFVPLKRAVPSITGILSVPSWTSFTVGSVGLIPLKDSACWNCQERRG